MNHAYILEELFTIIQDRKNSLPSESYVSSLYNKGTEAIARKVCEEATEVLIEAIKTDPERLINESADLLFHLMVLWADQDLAPNDVFETLKSRLGQNGHEEKASR